MAIKGLICAPLFLAGTLAAQQRVDARRLQDEAVQRTVEHLRINTTNPPLYQAIVQVTRRHFPDANIVAAVSTGFTDSHFFRDRAIACYGFAPFLIPAGDEAGVHGNNERILVENVRRGVLIMRDLVEQVASSH